jgi:hypothetical protein
MFKIKEISMDIIYIGIIGLLAGIGGTLGVQHAIRPKDKDDTVEVLNAIKGLEDSIHKAEADAIKNLTEVDLLKIPCSSEYIEKQGESLCREMFCRMNRQGQGQGSTTQECDAIGNAINSKAAIQTCMTYWDDSTTTRRGGLDQNSRYARCISLFDKRK